MWFAESLLDERTNDPGRGPPPGVGAVHQVPRLEARTEKRTEPRPPLEFIAVKERETEDCCSTKTPWQAGMAKERESDSREEIDALGRACVRACVRLRSAES